MKKPEKEHGYELEVQKITPSIKNYNTLSNKRGSIQSR